MKKFTFTVMAFALAYSQMSSADIVLSSTRVIYEAGQKESTIKMNNTGTRPLLTQSWIDAGDASIAPEKISTPFIIMPPVSRIEPKEGQTLRISYAQGQLPSDKESLFWLNVLEIPPKSKNLEGKNTLQISFRTRIKLIYRPQGLPGSADKALPQVKWHLNKEKDAVYLVAENPSSYYINMTDATVQSGGKTYQAEDVDYIEPKKSKSFLVKNLSASTTGKLTVKGKALNDFGGSMESTQEIN